MDRVSSGETKRLAELRSQLGDRTLRTLLTHEDKRLMRPERISNLLAGRGKLSEWERSRLQTVSTNAPKIKQLKAKGKGKREFQSNRALRSWLSHGKAKGVEYKEQDAPEKESQQQAIKALRFLGVDPGEGKFYVRKGSAK